MVNLEFADNLDDDEYPDEPEQHDDWNDDDESQTTTCPLCGAEVYEDAERCPVCESYITRGSGSRPIWWTAVVLVVLAGLLTWSCF